jgi:hypothetical protein
MCKGFGSATTVGSLPSLVLQGTKPAPLEAYSE